MSKRMSGLRNFKVPYGMVCPGWCVAITKSAAARLPKQCSLASGRTAIVFAIEKMAGKPRPQPKAFARAKRCSDSVGCFARASPNNQRRIEADIFHTL